MKKILMLLMLGFTISFGAYASNGILKEKKEENKVGEILNEKSIKTTRKLFVEYCLVIEPFYCTCPDGSDYIESVGLTLKICGEGGQVFEAVIVSYSNEEESC
jgi:hypothetical protein